MLDHDEQFDIDPTGGELALHSISDISAAPAPGTKQDTERDLGAEWIQRAIDGIRLMHADESVRRQVAKRLF